MKKVLITGATSGMGKMLAEKFVSEKYFLVLVGRDSTRIDELRKLFKGKENISIFKLDLSNQKDLESFAKKHGRNFDIIINSSAYFGPTEKIQNIKYEELSESFKTNVIAPAILTKYSLPHMYKKKFGRIINFGSTSGIVPYPLRIPYGVSKNALAMLTSTINSEIFIEDKKINIKSYYLVIPPTSGDRLEKQIIERAKSTGKEIGYIREKFKSIKGRFLSPNEIIDEIMNLIKDDSKIDKERTGKVYFE
jgi:hypothetical protein